MARLFRAALSYQRRSETRLGGSLPTGDLQQRRIELDERSFHCSFFGVGEPNLVCLRRKGLERVLTTGVQVKERGEQRTAHRVNLDSMRGEVVHVSQRRFGRPWPCSAFSRNPFLT